MILVGYGPSESRCLPHSGTSAKSVAVFSLSWSGNNRNYSPVKIGSFKCASGAAFFVCRASSGGPRRNSDYPKQNRNNFSRNRNRYNEEKDNFENLDESDLLTSKNGPLLSLSNTPKFQATAAPGPREKEIVELFRKVQAQLRERAAVKEEKKVETAKGKGKESETVDSLLKLLRKHSIEQGKKKISNNDGDFGLEQSEQNETENEDKSVISHSERNAIVQPNSNSITRPPSNFRRKSPVPKVKFDSIYSSDLTLEKKKRSEELPDNDKQPQLDKEETEVFNELSEGEASDTEEHNGEEPHEEDEDLSSMKLVELRALAKARGIKGFSKMKKGDLVELLSSK